MALDGQQKGRFFKYTISRKVHVCAHVRSWGKTQELTTIKSGGIWYKKAEVYAVIVNLFGNTAILLNDIDLEGVVGGNTVTNPFMVTEVYIKDAGRWKMGSLTFSRLMRPVRMNNNSQNNKQ